LLARFLSSATRFCVASLRRSRAVDGVAKPPEEDAASRARFTRSHPRAMSSPETGKKLAGDRCAPEPPGTKMTTARVLRD